MVEPRAGALLMRPLFLGLFTLATCTCASDTTRVSSDNGQPGSCERLQDLKVDLSCDCREVGGDDVTFGVQSQSVAAGWPDAPLIHVDPAACLVGVRSDGHSYLFVGLFSNQSDAARVVEDKRSCLIPSHPPLAPLDSTGRCVTAEPGWFVTCDDPVCRSAIRRTQ